MTSSIREIEKSSVLRLFGCALSFTHLLTIAQWIFGQTHTLFSSQTDVICWPMGPDCLPFHIFSETQIYAIFSAYGLASIVVAILFSKERTVKWAYYGLIFLSVLKLALMALDFRTRMNQHIMVGFATALFLFVPHKKIGLKALIALFYFWTGVLKLNLEWLTGAALYVKPWFFDGQMLPVVCSYVVILEIILIWFLFSKKHWIRNSVFAQLLLFHLFSWKIVGFFYPMLMFTLLSIFPLSWRINDELGTGPKLGTQNWIFLALFSALQILPWFYPGDTSLTGEGRMLALHMFDAMVSCESRAMIHEKNGQTIVLDLRRPLPIRLRCDPIVYLSIARQLCDEKKNDPQFLDFDLSLRSKRALDAELKPVIDLRNFCANQPGYRLFRTNDWILK